MLIEVRRVALVVATLLASVTVAQADDGDTAPPRTLDLKGALDFFHAHGLDLLIAEANIASVAGDVIAADAIPNPALSLGYGRSFYTSCPGGGCGTPPAYYSIGVSDSAAIEDTLSGKRKMRGDVARAALAAARLSRTDAERTLVFQDQAAVRAGVGRAASRSSSRATPRRRRTRHSSRRRNSKRRPARSATPTCCASRRSSSSRIRRSISRTRRCASPGRARVPDRRAHAGAEISSSLEPRPSSTTSRRRSSRPRPTTRCSSARSMRGPICARKKRRS